MVDALGPVDVHVRLRQDGLAVVAIHRVQETVARRMRYEFAHLPRDHTINENVGADLIVIPEVAGRVLEKPVHRSRIGVPRDRTVCIEVVTGPISWIEHRDGVASSPDGLVGVGVVSSGHPNRGTSGLPGVIFVLP
jgi:hypothetical protein